MTHISIVLLATRGIPHVQGYTFIMVLYSGHNVKQIPYYEIRIHSLQIINNNLYMKRHVVRGLSIVKRNVFAYNIGACIIEQSNGAALEIVV